MRIILLKERSGNRILPIWIGPDEGDFIALKLENLAIVRPTSLDLAARLIEASGMKIDKVAVTALRENVYYATMWTNAGGVVHEIDARPSDAITIALEINAPIFVSEETWKASDALALAPGSELAGLDELQRKAIAEGRAQPDPTEMEFRSYRSLPRGDVPGIRPRT
jgi:hypothetical protein